MARTTTSPVRDLMRRIEELRLQAKDCTPAQYEVLRHRRAILRELLREQRHREHLRDMELAQAMPEHVHYAPQDARWGSLDDEVHGVGGGFAAMVLGTIGTVVLSAALVVGLLAYFDVLTPAPAPIVAKVGKQ